MSQYVKQYEWEKAISAAKEYAFVAVSSVLLENAAAELTRLRASQEELLGALRSITKTSTGNAARRIAHFAIEHATDGATQCDPPENLPSQEGAF
jgi:hypothetical protein